MDLTKLFEMQKVLRDRINYNEPDRFNKLILALLVELGECANEQRSWKFWSKDQEPRIKVPIAIWGEPYHNPLLEEYVDGLHFVLEIGIEKGWNGYQFMFENVGDYLLAQTPLELFDECFWSAASLTSDEPVEWDYLADGYLKLGKSLGFTWEQIEQAYLDKNKINHERQNNGY